ncbi:MAG: glycosyltransferase family 4 protein [Bacteroidetes bacterium]|nr:glycosyltransferase family 4 protein [Bacteroidota bacterium]
MKVTFTFSGLPHYLIALLNKLVSSHRLDVSVIIPGKRGISIGEGVRLDNADGDYLFSIYQIEEYRGRLGKPYFRDLHRTLNEISPDILVMGWPFILNLYFDSESRRVLKRNKISLVFREIPFMVAPKNQAIKYYRKHPVINENLEVDNPTGVMFYPWAFALNQMRKRYYRLADATMIYSSSGIEIHESFGIVRENIFVTYNSPDTEKLARTRDKLKKRGVSISNPKRILHLGRLVKWKRVDLLIEAVAKLSGEHDTIELFIIGAGPEEEKLKRLAGQMATEGKIKFLGSIYDPEALSEEIISSAIYVLAGMGGLSINEAMAFGKPVICSRCDGTETDLVTDGENGLYFMEGDAIDLASKINTLLNDPDRTRAMGDKALSVIQEKINLETVAQRFMDCFLHVRSS